MKLFSSSLFLGLIFSLDPAFFLDQEFIEKTFGIIKEKILHLLSDEKNFLVIDDRREIKEKEMIFMKFYDGFKKITITNSLNDKFREKERSLMYSDVKAAKSSMRARVYYILRDIVEDLGTPDFDVLFTSLGPCEPLNGKSQEESLVLYNEWIHQSFRADDMEHSIRSYPLILLSYLLEMEVIKLISIKSDGLEICLFLDKSFLKDLFRETEEIMDPENSEEEIFLSIFKNLKMAFPQSETSLDLTDKQIHSFLELWDFLTKKEAFSKRIARYLSQSLESISRFLTHLEPKYPSQVNEEDFLKRFYLINMVDQIKKPRVLYNEDLLSTVLSSMDGILKEKLPLTSSTKKFVEKIFSCLIKNVGKSPLVLKPKDLEQKKALETYFLKETYSYLIDSFIDFCVSEDASLDSLFKDLKTSIIKKVLGFNNPHTYIPRHFFESLKRRILKEVNFNK